MKRFRKQSSSSSSTRNIFTIDSPFATAHAARTLSSFVLTDIAIRLTPEKKKKSDF
jgi:hypothetical protein